MTCKAKQENNGVCPHHNLHCGWPQCNEPAQPYPENFIDALKYDVARRDSEQQCRTDGRCQYAIDSGAEGMGHCPKGKCVMPAQQEPVAWIYSHGKAKVVSVNYVPGVRATPLYTSPPAQQQEPEIVQRVKRFAGKTLRTARNPNITARECIELANWIVANTHGIKENT